MVSLDRLTNVPLLLLIQRNILADPSALLYRGVLPVAKSLVQIVKDVAES